MTRRHRIARTAACALACLVAFALAACGGGSAAAEPGACATITEISQAHGGDTRQGAALLVSLSPGPEVQIQPTGGSLLVQATSSHTQTLAPTGGAVALLASAQVWRRPGGPAGWAAPAVPVGAAQALGPLAAGAPAASALQLPPMVVDDTPGPGIWLYELRTTVQALDAQGQRLGALLAYTSTTHWQVRQCSARAAP